MWRRLLEFFGIRRGNRQNANPQQPEDQPQRTESSINEVQPPRTQAQTGCREGTSGATRQQPENQQQASESNINEEHPPSAQAQTGCHEGTSGATTCCSGKCDSNHQDTTSDESDGPQQECSAKDLREQTSLPTPQTLYARAPGDVLNNRNFQVGCSKCMTLFSTPRAHREQKGHEPTPEAAVVKCNACERFTEWGKLECKHCDAKFGEYVCGLCMFITFETAYHCDKCGKCKLGDREKSFHCDGCNNCLHIFYKDNHKCRPYDPLEKCYICLENVWHHGKIVKGLPCSHVLHKSCFYEYAEATPYSMWKCGLCRARVPF